jgi:hypothetical protein
MWVLTNHIYDNNMSFVHLFPFLSSDCEIVFITLFELSNYLGEEVNESLIKSDHAMESLINSLDNKNKQIMKNSLWIIGNVLAEK